VRVKNKRENVKKNGKARGNRIGLYSKKQLPFQSIGESVNFSTNSENCLDILYNPARIFNAVQRGINHEDKLGLAEISFG